MTCHAKNMILAKNSRYAKMRENSCTFVKIEWAPVQSLWHVGYCNFPQQLLKNMFSWKPEGFFDIPIVKKMTESLKPLKTPQNGQF